MGVNDLILILSLVSLTVWALIVIGFIVEFISKKKYPVVVHLFAVVAILNLLQAAVWMMVDNRGTALKDLFFAGLLWYVWNVQRAARRKQQRAAQEAIEAQAVESEAPLPGTRPE